MNVKMKLYEVNKIMKIKSNEMKNGIIKNNYY